MKFLVTLAVFALSTSVYSSSKADTSGGPGHSHRHFNEPANPRLPSLFIIGDSTVRNAQGIGTGRQWGWGDLLAPYFDTNKINVVNRALGGTSSRTFYS